MGLSRGEWLRVWAVIAVGLAVRACVVFATPLPPLLAHRVELSTPLTSPLRATEAVFVVSTPAATAQPDVHTTAPLPPPPPGGWSLANSLAAPSSPFARVYAAHTSAPIHVPPLLLAALWAVAGGSPEAVLSQTALALLASACDMVAALALAAAAGHVALWDPSLPLRPHQAAAAYILNPMTVLSACAGSLVAVANALLLPALAAATAGHALLASALLAAAAYAAVSPLVLAVPLALVVAKAREWSPARGLATVAAAVTLTAALLAAASSWAGGGGVAWAHVAYGPMLRMSSLRPNIGLWWYFHQEMFEHFKTFFICVFHMYALVFVAPLTIKFGHAPVFLFVVVAGIMSTFKPYPQMGDTAAYVALCALVAGLLPHMRYAFLTLNVGLFACAVLPTFWYIWIEVEAGNANFFYNTTLVFAFANIWLILDLLHARSMFDASRATPIASTTPTSTPTS